jgi:hypothetical protein
MLLALTIMSLHPDPHESILLSSMHPNLANIARTWVAASIVTGNPTPPPLHPLLLSPLNEHTRGTSCNSCPSDLIQWLSPPLHPPSHNMDSQNLSYHCKEHPHAPCVPPIQSSSPKPSITAECSQKEANTAIAQLLAFKPFHNVVRKTLLKHSTSTPKQQTRNARNIPPLVQQTQTIIPHYFPSSTTHKGKPQHTLPNITTSVSTTTTVSMPKRTTSIPTPSTNYARHRPQTHIATL